MTNTNLSDMALNGLIASICDEGDAADLGWSDPWVATNIEGETRRARKLVWIWDVAPFASFDALVAAIREARPDLRPVRCDEDDGTPALVVSEDAGSVMSRDTMTMPRLTPTETANLRATARQLLDDERAERFAADPQGRREIGAGRASAGEDAARKLAGAKPNHCTTCKGPIGEDDGCRCPDERTPEPR